MQTPLHKLWQRSRQCSPCSGMCAAIGPSVHNPESLESDTLQMTRPITNFERQIDYRHLAAAAYQGRFPKTGTLRSIRKRHMVEIYTVRMFLEELDHHRMKPHGINRHFGFGETSYSALDLGLDLMPSLLCFNTIKDGNGEPERTQESDGSEGQIDPPGHEG